MKLQWRSFVAVLWVVTLAATSTAQAPDAPTVEDLQARLAAAKESPAEEARGLVETYEKALAALGRASEARERLQRFTGEAAEAPARIVSLQEELATPPSEPDLSADPSLALSDMEQRLEQAQAELTAARSMLEELEAVATRRVQRKSELPEEITAAQEELDAVEESLNALPAEPGNEPRRALLLAQAGELRAVAQALEAERETYDARRELLPLRRDRALRRVTQAEKVAAFWQGAVEARRTREGEAAAEDAKEQLEDITARLPLLQQLAEETRELAARRSGSDGLPRRISRARDSYESTRARLEGVRDRFRAARRRIAAGGLTEGMGLTLRRDYEWLPQVADLRAVASTREKRLSEAQLELIAIEEERAEVGDLVTATERILENLDAPRTQELETAIRELLTTERAAHDAVLADLEALTGIYYEHEQLSNALIESSLEYRQYIENRILWVRSAALNPTQSLLSAPTHAAEITEILTAPETLGAVGQQAAREKSRLALTGVLIVALFALRPLLKRKRVLMGTRVRSFRTDKYVYTVRALVESILLAVLLPLVAWSLGRLLTQTPGELVRAVGHGLQEIAVVWMVLRLLAELTVDMGLGSAHFKWPTDSLAALRGELRWFEPVAVGLGAIALSMNHQSSTAWLDSVGRLAFVGAMVALAIFAHRLLRAGDHMKGHVQAAKGLLGRTHGTWSLVAVALPLGLAVLSLVGYTYTAMRFELRLRYSIGFAIALVLVNALLLRWLFLTRRRLAVRQALEAKARREQEEAEKGGATESGSMALDADQVDIPSIDAQTRKLFQKSLTLATVVGLYFIWASVLPALRGLDRVQILPTPAILEADIDLAQLEGGAPAPSDSASEASAAKPVTPIPIPRANGTGKEDAPGTSGLPSQLTLADVLLALVFGLLTSVAARNLPALLELAILERLPLDGGSRYAVTTITRYLILVAGVSAVSGALGVGWSQVQWLVAALTFGLAFGLQEIFANFVSGLIILIERPIRVGDIVTVGQTEGRVTQLRMRATTIMDWDRRELLVPNKEFITGSVINWTLSDSVTRIIIPVGIAYGSDTKRARQLLLDVARRNPIVLEDPAPSAIFHSFGASSLDFQLRVFMPNRDIWPELVDKLHSQIDEAFRKADIEIAFPQRDLHIRSAEGLSGQHFRGEDGPEPQTH